MVLLFQESGIIELIDNTFSCSEPLLRHHCNIGGLSLHTHLFIPYLSYLSSCSSFVSFFFFFLPLKGTLGSATVLVHIAKSNTSLANVSYLVCTIHMG